MITAAQLVADYDALKAREASPASEAPNNRASVIGHPCTAYCYFNRVVPASQRKPLNPRLARIFSEGKDQARIIQNDLRDMGYDLTQQEKPLYWSVYQISGHLDWIISKGGQGFVRTEFKTCSPFTFRSINKPEDIRDHKWAFIRKWYGQVLLYSLLDNEEWYWLFLKDKSSGEIKILEFHLGPEELAYAEGLLKKAERVNRYVAESRSNPAWMIPENEKVNDPRICPECEFFAVCGPNVLLGPGLEIVTDGEIEKMLDRRGELAAGAGEFEELDGELKEYFKGRVPQGGLVSCGEWFVDVRWSERKDKVNVRRVTFYKPNQPCAACGVSLPSVRKREGSERLLCIGCYENQKEAECKKSTKGLSKKPSPATLSGHKPSRSVRPNATPQP